MTASDFRCLPSVDLQFDADFTLITGPNASGKTSLLEALYLLGRGRSFRTRRSDHLVRRGSSRFIVFGEVDVGDGRHVALGVEGGPQGLRARVGGRDLESLVGLASLFPVQIIDPEVHRLIEEGPGRRRRFLDWGVFHVEPSFVDTWRTYQRVLRQRNAALRTQAPTDLIGVWNADFARAGEALSAARSRYVIELAALVQPLSRRLTGDELSIAYRTGWGADRTLAEALQQSASQEQQLGFTQVGPHRADLVIRLGQDLVRDRVSRGQQKLIAATLLLGQIRLLSTNDGTRCTLLLDDPAAELDDTRLLSLIEEVAAGNSQVVATTLNGELSALGRPGRRYALRDGTAVITPVE